LAPRLLLPGWCFVFFGFLVLFQVIHATNEIIKLQPKFSAASFPGDSPPQSCFAVQLYVFGCSCFDVSGDVQVPLPNGPSIRPLVLPGILAIPSALTMFVVPCSFLSLTKRPQDPRQPEPSAVFLRLFAMFFVLSPF